MMRLQKMMAEAAVGSRRACEKLIQEGRVKVNGAVVTELGTKVDPEKDQVELDGNKVQTRRAAQNIYYMLHKPVGYVTTASDEQGRDTVLSLVPQKDRVYPVGRLDIMSSGLLLLTNDGDLTYKLTHPKHAIAKQYVVKVRPPVPEDRILQLQKGGDIGPYAISPSKIRLLSSDGETAVYRVAIKEGKNRQIRRMFEFVDAQVVRLQRVAVGELTLGDLPKGAYRALTEQEISYLKGL
ncbi:pseudouridine synthase [Anaerotalea alkaliphila]|uniref:Pseudouridine synthase n=1 Tax=Anaerotalea alkaliphila TaxID=2662126 RepID=A0A7X5HTE2_9FIRM|nr:pseudouridine synthase [Anaerotalea alkaliphila]NDL66294.1 rRNA pseudouridine synthase [Anaerotalea alkaliphila]